MFFNIAKAHIKGSSKFPEIDGIVTFKEVKDGVLLTTKINGLPQSKDQFIGKVVIIHDMPDDFIIQPSGNSSTKIACGKIKKVFI